MGQRSQIYVTFNNNKTLVAYHLQWNYGHYMISRATQLLKQIKQDAEYEYTHLLDTPYSKYDHGYIPALIQINNDINSWVGGVDLVKDVFENGHIGGYCENDGISFKMNPLDQDNNNGILVIDISGEKKNLKVKYGFFSGYEDDDNGMQCKNGKMLTAKEYNAPFTRDYEMKHCETKEDKEELKAEIERTEKEIEYIDSNFELLTEKDYKRIFNKKRLFTDCIDKWDIKGFQLTRDENEKEYINTMVRLAY